MRRPEEWPSCRTRPADRIRLIGPAATLLLFSIHNSVHFFEERDTVARVNIVRSVKTPKGLGERRSQAKRQGTDSVALPRALPY